jgi:hypothetical protein
MSVKCCGILDQPDVLDESSPALQTYVRGRNTSGMHVGLLQLCFIREMQCGSFDLLKNNPDKQPGQ